MTCNCGSDDILSVSAKCSDCCSIRTNHVEADGYVPSDMGIGGGDYLRFKICMRCGLVQNWKPITNKDVAAAVKDM